MKKNINVHAYHSYFLLTNAPTSDGKDTPRREEEMDGVRQDEHDAVMCVCVVCVYRDM